MLDTARRMAKMSQDVWRGIGRVDRAAAKRRVAALHERYPEASTEELHRSLVLAKCIQVGVVSGIARLAEFLPGGGLLSRSILGPLGEGSLLTMLQAELIVESFDLYGVELPSDAERLAVTALAGTQIGVRHAGIESARALVASIQRALGGAGWTRIAIPLGEALTGALSEIVLTWAIGMRAGALARMPRARAAEWPDLIRQFVQFDERRLTEWTTAAARDAVTKAAALGQLWLGQIRDFVGPLTVASAQPRSQKDIAAQPRKSASSTRRASTARQASTRQRTTERSSSGKSQQLRSATPSRRRRSVGR